MGTDETAVSEPIISRVEDLPVADHDGTILGRNLALSPEQRFERFLAAVAFVEELRRARMVEHDD